MKRALSLCLLIPLAVLGCQDEERNRPERLQAPEQGANAAPNHMQIANQIIQEAQLEGPVPPAGSRMPPFVRQNVLRILTDAKTQHAGTQEGDKALAIVASKVENRIRLMERNELWEHTVAYIDAYKIFNPNSVKYNQIRDQAMVELRKPRVIVRGLPEFDGEKVAVVSIYLPLTSESFDERMFIGDELHGVRFVGVFGEDRGITLEYLETGERYIAYLPAAM